MRRIERRLWRSIVAYPLAWPPTDLRPVFVLIAAAC
jgi:hypothetical protein